jgi:hypothetical protein
LLLRVSGNPAGGWDALDQFDDQPRKGESLYVYMLTELPLVYHLLARGKGKAKVGGWWQQGKYRLLDPQPEADVLWFNEDWRRWCAANGPRLEPEWWKLERERRASGQ